MATLTVTIAGDLQRQHAKGLIDAAPVGSVVTVQEKGEARTKAQNRLVHRWFTDIARHHSFGQSEADVKADCNLTYGLPILTRDDVEWGACFGYIFDAMNKPSKLKAIRVLDVPFTRRMGVQQLNEYMGQMQQDYAEQGVFLTDPELRGVEQR
jgi:hypothetical protein